LDALDSLGKVDDRAKGFVEQFGGWLMKSGTAAATKASLVVLYADIMVSLGIEMGKTTVKVGKSYIDGTKNRIEEFDRIAKGKIKQEDIRLPAAPEPLEDYSHRRNGELLLNKGMVATAIRKAYQPERAAIKAELYAEHESVRSKFESDEFPKIYAQHRREIMQNIRQIDTKDNIPLAHSKAFLLRFLEDHGSNPSKERLAEEIKMLAKSELNFLSESSFHPGIADERNVLRRFYSETGQSEYAGINHGIQKLYTAELNKSYERQGVGRDALEKRYAERGVSDADMIRAIVAQESKLGLR